MTVFFFITVFCHPELAARPQCNEGWSKGDLKIKSFFKVWLRQAQPDIKVNL
jgi:hypothetical protein